jgi:hypothetical protein
MMRIGFNSTLKQRLMKANEKPSGLAAVFAQRDNATLTSLVEQLKSRGWSQGKMSTFEVHVLYETRLVKLLLNSLTKASAASSSLSISVQ